MFVTDKFVMIHFPKTGSTFARKALKRIYAPCFSRRNLLYWMPFKPARELQLPVEHIRRADIKWTKSRSIHGTVSQIPSAYASRRVVTVVRDPVARFLSLYHYRDWAVNHVLPEQQLVADYPQFPNLSIDEYLDLTERHGAKQFLGGLREDFPFGPQTAQFMAYYAKDPIRLLGSVNESYSILRNPQDFASITYLRTERLNVDLFRFLLESGLSQEKIRFIENAKPENRSVQHSGLSAQQVERIRTSEKLLYELFPFYATDEGVA